MDDGHYGGSRSSPPIFLFFSLFFDVQKIGHRPFLSLRSVCKKRGSASLFHLRFFEFKTLLQTKKRTCPSPLFFAREANAYASLAFTVHENGLFLFFESNLLLQALELLLDLTHPTKICYQIFPSTG